ncbi:GLPGLI family protein [[Muricauda] lutisoli]|uniref:GLPGLI family protein n=1 Tax=[Muricauda] lutisoli TaxID=2816035 RepID=A0ABS3EX44_9FLAO|nr:GLPGLI family protein [[Muricauda] lutisoli]MBO0330829.1 GLPGLI family protein [[Muricauda] lutisoli]
MNRLLLLWAIFAPLSLLAQKTSGSAEYKLMLKKSKNTEMKGAYQNDIDEIAKQALNFRFELVFDKHASLFSLIRNLPFDKNSFSTKMAITIFDGDKTYFTNLNENYLIERKQVLGEQFQVKLDFDHRDWKLANEKKTIFGYECFKAIGKRTRLTKSFETVETELIAWYCPELAFRTGPFEAVGLPGMVLQLDLKGRSVVMTDLVFKDQGLIENPMNGQTITQKEFDSIYEKRIKVKLPR